MANRLAYEVDAALRRALLKFWGVKKLDTFFAEPPPYETAFSSLLSLDEASRKALAACVRAWRLQGHLVTRQGILEWSPTAGQPILSHSIAETGGLDRIESLYLVECLRDRTNLARENDRILPTAFLRALIAGRWSPVDGEYEGPLPTAPCPPAGRDFVRRVYESGWWRESLPAGIELPPLLVAGHLLAGFDHDGAPALFAPAWPADEGEPEVAELVLAYEAQEKPALLLHQLHLRLFGQAPRKLIEEDRALGLLPATDEALAQWVAWVGRRPRRFACLPLAIQYRRLLMKRNPLLIPFVKRLVKAIGDTASFSMPTLRRALSRESITGGALPMDKEEAIAALVEMGLAVTAQTRIAFAPEFLSAVAGGKLPPVSPEDRLVMDSDLAITLYRNAIIPPRLHFLLSLGSAKKSEHLWTIRLDTARIPFHLFLGRGPGRARAFFRRHAPSYWNETAADHLDQLFRQCESVRGGTRRLLHTWSRASLERMRGALEAEHIPFRAEETTAAGMPHAIVFSRAAHYHKARRVLRQRRIPLV